MYNYANNKNKEMGELIRGKNPKRSSERNETPGKSGSYHRYKAKKQPIKRIVWISKVKQAHRTAVKGNQGKRKQVLLICSA